MNSVAIWGSMGKNLYVAETNLSQFVDYYGNVSRRFV